MNELDFHIDETVIHSATIDQKKDFDKLMADFAAGQTQTTATALGAYWISSAIVVGLSVISLALFNGGDQNQESPGTHQAVVISHDTPNNEQLLAHVPITTKTEETNEVILDDAIIESVVSAKIEETKAPKEARSTMKKEPILEPNVPIKRTSIAEAIIKHPVAVKTSKPKSIPASSIKVPSGIELNVDLMTYAELKKNKHYFFEVDTLKSKAGEELFDMEWDEADLKRHPDKDRYRMVLKKNNQKREIIVRLVKNSLQIQGEKKWRLFARK